MRPDHCDSHLDHCRPNRGCRHPCMVRSAADGNPLPQHRQKADLPRYWWHQLDSWVRRSPRWGNLVLTPTRHHHGPVELQRGAARSAPPPHPKPNQGKEREHGRCRAGRCRAAAASTGGVLTVAVVIDVVFSTHQDRPLGAHQNRPFTDPSCTSLRLAHLSRRPREERRCDPIRPRTEKNGIYL